MNNLSNLLLDELPFSARITNKQIDGTLIDECFLEEMFINLSYDTTFCVVDETFLVTSYFTDIFYPKLIEFNERSDRKAILFYTTSCINTLTHIGEAKVANSQIAIQAKEILSRDQENIKLYPAQCSCQSTKAEILSAVIQEATQKKVFVLTQNTSLKCDIDHIRKFRSMVMKKMTAMYCEDDCRLAAASFYDERKKLQRKNEMKGDYAYE